MVRALLAQDVALLRVGERLIVAGAPLCREQGRSAGMTVQLIDQYSPSYRAAAEAILGVTGRPSITVVSDGGAAERAGLRPRDTIVAIDGHTFEDAPVTRTAATFGRTAAMLDVIEAAMSDGHATLTVLRGVERRDIALAPRVACRARFDVRAGRHNNATSDGTYVQVSSDLMAQVRNDGELATILAHELAHNILRHPQRRKLHEPGLTTRATEIAADRLSVYLLDAAGYGVDDAVAFWSRWGKASDYGILADGSHPGWEKRIATITAEAAAIAAARAAGRPVAPPPDLVALQVDRNQRRSSSNATAVKRPLA